MDLKLVKLLESNVEIKREWRQLALSLGIPESDVVELEAPRGPASMERIHRVGTTREISNITWTASARKT